MTSNHLLLRVATITDAQLIADMHGRSRRSAYRGLVPDDYLDHGMRDELSTHWPQKMKEIAAGDGHALIAEWDGQPVAFVCMSQPDEEGSVYLDNLHAMPGHKGAGIGTALLDAAQKWAVDQGARQMHLMVVEGNDAAVGFYEHRGWRYAGSVVDPMGGMEIPALRYVLDLG